MPQLYDQFHDGESTPPRRIRRSAPPSQGYPMTPSPMGRRSCRRRSRTPPPVIPILLSLAVIVTALIIVLTHLRPSATAPDNDPSAPPPASDALTASPEPTPTSNNQRDIAIPEWIDQDLLPLNEWSQPGDPLLQVNGVVVHYVGNPGTTAEQNRSYFKNLAETHETYASSHFLIGMDGKIIQCVPLNEISYCSTVRNVDTIAIECCHPDAEGKFTDETMASLVKLVDWLIETYDLQREDIIRHYDVAGKECPIYYVRNPDAWEGFLDELTFPIT